ncbi:MAG: MBL fold metallo-hydrolase [Promethearchaeota archaeon]
MSAVQKRRVGSEPVEVADGLYWVPGANGATFPNCHAYLLDIGGEFVAFDPCCGRRRLRASIRHLGAGLAKVKAVVNTHFHADHTLENGYLKRKAGARVYIHGEDRPALESVDAYISRYGMEGNATLLSGWREFLEAHGLGQAAATDSFSDGDVLFGRVRVVHTPGHSPGHCSFLLEGDGRKTLIAGDLDLSVPWVANASSNVADFLASVGRVQKLGVDVYLPAHGEPVFDDITRRLREYSGRLLDREEKLLQCLPEKPATLEEILGRVAERRPDWSAGDGTATGAFKAHFRRITTRNYLLHLVGLGRVETFVEEGVEFWRLP